MADEEDQPVTPVAPPPQVPVPRGTGYTYSTPGPGNWQNPQTVAGPGGPVQIPQNAQNFTSIVGPPPEDQETAAFRKMFNSLPMDQAIKAYQAAKQFQGQRVLQSKLAGYSAAGLPPEQALSRAMTDAAAVGLFSTPKEMLDLNKTLHAAAAERAKADFRPTEFNLPSGQRMVQTRPGMYEMPKPLPVEKPGAMTQKQVHEFQMLQADKSGLQKSLAGATDPEQQKEVQGKIKEIADRERELLGLPARVVPPPAAAVTPAKTPRNYGSMAIGALGGLAGSVAPGVMEAQESVPEKPLDKATAAKFLKEAKGDKAKARQLAKNAGYTF